MQTDLEGIFYSHWITCFNSIMQGHIVDETSFR